MMQQKLSSMKNQNLATNKEQQMWGIKNKEQHNLANNRTLWRWRRRQNQVQAGISNYRRNQLQVGITKIAFEFNP